MSLSFFVTCIIRLKVKLSMSCFVHKSNLRSVIRFIQPIASAVNKLEWSEMPNTKAGLNKGEG